MIKHIEDDTLKFVTPGGIIYWACDLIGNDKVEQLCYEKLNMLNCTRLVIVCLMWASTVCLGSHKGSSYVI